MNADLGDVFRRRFQRLPTAAARAPGRVNLIGEHTDYNQGLVLPCAIDRETVAMVAPRDDSRFRVWSQELEVEAGFSARDLVRRGSWIDYVQGVVFALAERGFSFPGFDLAVASRVPREAGLSSSAALCVSVVTVLNSAAGLGLDARERALLAHRGESEFVGVGCGILDHFASALGRRDHALRIDCRSQETRAVRLPPVALLVAHSGVTRALAVRGYTARVAECRAALAAARRSELVDPAAEALRDVSPEALGRAEATLDPLLFRRLRHVVRENLRVEACCRALSAGDLEAVGALLKEGQRSLRDDFEVSTPELDLLCEIADALPGVFGSRLTGAGFGGCTLHLVESDRTSEVSKQIAARFEAQTGRPARVIEVRSSDGACEVELP